MRRNGTKTCFHVCTGEGNRRGVVLMLTVVVLVILATICYTLSARLARLRRRQQYMIDYQKSRYACDSAMKFAMTVMKGVPLSLAARQDEPDFSDIFMMDHEQYEQFKAEWAERKAQEMLLEEEDETSDSAPASDTRSLSEGLDPSDPNASSGVEMFMSGADTIDSNSIEIPGPYGPQWPLIHEPIEFEMGDSTVTIRIEDENAKMPLTWAMTSNLSNNLRAEAAFETFCEWMQMDVPEIDTLKDQVAEMSKYKRFSLSLKPVTYTERTQVKTTRRSTSTRLRTSRSRSSSPGRSTTRTRTVKKTRPAIAHATDFAKLLHSSLLDTERLAWAIPNTGYRSESPLKYLALWGSQRININTAPRHVLEAAFTFGGDAREIAHEIILMRQEKPIKDIAELKNKLYGYNDSIRKVEPYITTKSKFFAVKVTARTGVARASSVATMIREGRNVQRIAVLAD